MNCLKKARKNANKQSEGMNTSLKERKETQRIELKELNRTVQYLKIKIETTKNVENSENGKFR